jgi:hypothetical protein
MKFKNGLIVGPIRCFSNEGPSKTTWLIAAFHSPKSITWKWCILWMIPPKGFFIAWLRHGFGFMFFKQNEVFYKEAKP